MPRFILAPAPHKDDKEYNISNNTDYFPYNDDSDNIKCDISGALHDCLNLYKDKDKRKFR